MYEQPRATFARRKAVPVALLLVALTADALASVLILQFNLTNPTAGTVGWLLFGFLVMLVPAVLIIGGDEFTRTKFAVYEEGFTPPFASLGQFLHRERPFVAYSSFARATCRYYIRHGVSRIDELSIELMDGSLITVRERDIDQEGLEALLGASEDYRHRALREGRPEAAPRRRELAVPPWVQKEMRRELLESGAVLLGIVIVLAALALSPGVLETGFRILFPLIVLPAAVPYLLFRMHRAWRRARAIAEQRLKEIQEPPPGDESDWASGGVRPPIRRGGAGGPVPGKGEVTPTSRKRSSASRSTSRRAAGQRRANPQRSLS
ncbi:MAG: hypothetical protein ACE5LS_06745 [Thermoplasmata archaeon]